MGSKPKAVLPPGFYLDQQDGTTWRQEDWDWDSQALVAGARPQAGGGSGATTRACQAPMRLADELLLASAHMHNGDSKQSTGDANARPPAGASDGGRGAAAIKSPAPAKRRAPARSGCCQADGCDADLARSTYYHVRNKICEVHVKADSFLRDGAELRFCQRCGHAHSLPEFDVGKHSCRKQLEKHNARRRKRQAARAAGANEARGSSDDSGAPVPRPRQQSAAARRSTRPRNTHPVMQQPSSDEEVSQDEAQAAPPAPTAAQVAQPAPLYAQRATDAVRPSPFAQAMPLQPVPLFEYAAPDPRLAGDAVQVRMRRTACSASHAALLHTTLTDFLFFPCRAAPMPSWPAA